MNPDVKKFLWLLGYGVMLAAGCLLAVNGVIQSANLAVFLLGLLFLWDGFSSILGWNGRAAKMEPGFRKAYSLCMTGLGAVWPGFSLTPLANQTGVLCFVSLPFFVVLLTARNRSKW